MARGGTVKGEFQQAVSELKLRFILCDTVFLPIALFSALCINVQRLQASIGPTESLADLGVRPETKLGIDFELL